MTTLWVCTRCGDHGECDAGDIDVVEWTHLRECPAGFDPYEGIMVIEPCFE